MPTGQATRRTPKRHCVHHWIVEPAGGPTSGARCRRCGEKRDFFNNPDAVAETDVRARSGFARNTTGHQSRSER